MLTLFNVSTIVCYIGAPNVNLANLASPTKLISLRPQSCMISLTKTKAKPNQT